MRHEADNPNISATTLHGGEPRMNQEMAAELTRFFGGFTPLSRECSLIRRRITSTKRTLDCPEGLTVADGKARGYLWYTSRGRRYRITIEDVS